MATTLINGVICGRNKYSYCMISSGSFQGCGGEKDESNRDYSVLVFL
jgi:hypothetical protein